MAYIIVNGIITIVLLCMGFTFMGAVGITLLLDAVLVVGLIYLGARIERAGKATAVKH